MNPAPSTNHRITPVQTGFVSQTYPINRAAGAMMTIVTLMLLPTGCRTPPSRTNAIKPIALHNMRTELELTLRQRSDQRNSKLPTGDESFDESVFQQRLRFGADGYVYHPNLLDFSLAMVGGLQQSEFDQNRDGRIQNSSADDTLEEFDLRASLFKNKDFPVTLTAIRSRTFDPRPFRSSLETTTTSFDFTWQYTNPKIPTLLQISNTNIDFNPFLGAGERPGSRENTVVRFETKYLFSENNILYLKASSEKLLELPLDLQYNTDQFSIEHRLDFGSDKQHRLDSTMRYMEQQGSFAIERLEWWETLRLQHTDRLRSWYVFNFIDRTQGNLSGAQPVQETNYSISASIEHRLYESLTSRISGRYQNQEFGSGLNINRQTIGAYFDYQKKNRWGMLRSNYSVQLELQKRTGGDQIIAMTDEPHTFRDPDPIIITDPNINLATLTIMREDRTETFVRGRDFRIQNFGNRIEIDRIPTGRIRDEETVLLSYQSTLVGDFDLNTIQHRFGIRQDFDFGLSIYYRLYQQNQTLTPPSAMGTSVEDITSHILGAEYRKDRFRLFAEIEDHNSTISPFESFRIGGDYSRNIGKATASISSVWSDITFRDQLARKITLWTVDGRYRHPITRKFNINTGFAYRNERDSIGGDNEGINFDVSTEWSFRTTEIKLTYEYGVFNNAFAEDQSQTLLVQFVRRF